MKFKQKYIPLRIFSSWHIFLYLLVFTCNIFAQFNENDFKKIRIEIDGEEVYNVTAIAQDHQGYIWMATNLGLIRYNGIEGKKYNNKINDSLILYDGIKSLFADHKGDIWIASKSGLSKYNPDCDCIYGYPSINEDTSLTNVRAIAEDKNRDLWIGTRNDGLFKYERESKAFTKFIHEPSDSIKLVSNSIEELLVDQNNNLWIGTDAYDSKKGAGLIRYNISTGDIKQFLHNPSNSSSLLDNRISALFEDQQGQILIGTYRSGFHIYDTKSESLNRISFNADDPSQIYATYTDNNVLGDDPFVKLIHQDKNGNYWIGTTGKGINYFNTRTKTFKNYSFNLVNPQLLGALYEDRQGNLWIGGMDSGLFKTDLFARKYNLNTNFINVESVYESPLNSKILWVYTRHGGLAKMNLKTSEITRYLHNEDNIKSIGHNWVRSVYQENDNTLWLGLGHGGAGGLGAGNGGVDRMDIKTGTFTHFKLTHSDDNRNDFSYTVYDIIQDTEGYLWLSTGKGGIFRSDKDKKKFKHFDNLRNDTSSTDYNLIIVSIDSNGDVWVSDFKDQGALYLYNREKDKFKLYLQGFKVTNVLIDDQGRYLISTWEKGLVHLNPKEDSYIQYGKNEGLPSNDALGIVKGDDGVFWVGTRMGPAIFDAETGEITSIGLPKGRYNYGIFKSSDNQIYLGANDGLVSFHPHQVIGNPYPPQLAISNLLISDKNYLTKKNDPSELNFSYNQNDITFKYIGLHYSNSDKNSYQYRLKPLNDKWINAGFERTARYFNLSPGSYNFQVKSANSDGVWNEESTAIQFTIKSVWWATWWAYAIYLGIAIFFADRFYRFQLSKKLATAESNRLKEVNHLKNSLYTNITHEFRTPLTVILGMADSLKSNVVNKQLDQAEESLEMIERNGKNLLRLVNEMLDLSKLESGNMELQLIQTDVIPFIKYLSESFHSLAQEKKINLTVYSEVDALVMDFDPGKMTSIISNVLSNAIKFTSANGKIIVHLKKELKNDKAFLFIKIKDNGLGISKKEISNIFNRFYQVDNTSSRKNEGTGIGLSLTKDFVELMKGHITVKSASGKGSAFIIKLPITNNANQTKHVESQIEPDLIKSEDNIKTDSKIPEEKSELPLALIIEDNKDVAHYLKTCLTGKYQTIHAINGKIGIETAFEKVPDIIICDVMMPVKDGFEVCTELKSDERTDHIPIIMLTAKVSMKDRLTGLSSGADAYLTKPFVKAELFTRLDQLILLRKRMMQKIENDSFSKFMTAKAENSETKFLQKIIKIIHEEINNHSFGSSIHISHKMHLSESQVYRKLKAITGKSTAVFIRSVRLQYAKELIQTTNKTISEIAYDVGFNDPSWFSRAFKEEFGFAPSAMSK